MNKSTPRGGGWRRLLLCIAVATCSHAASAQAVFKCQEGGQTVFKDHPCGGAQGTVADDMARKELEFKKRKQEQDAAVQQRAVDDAALLKLCGGKPVVDYPEVGMTESHFLNCTSVGRSKFWTVNETQTSNGISRQYVITTNYYVHIVKYIYTRNGMVTGLQR